MAFFVRRLLQVHALCDANCPPTFVFALLPMHDVDHENKFLQWIYLSHNYVLILFLFFSCICFDTVGWVTGRASGLYKISNQQFPKFLWEAFGKPSLTWSDIWKNRLVKQKP